MTDLIGFELTKAGYKMIGEGLVWKHEQYHDYWVLDPIEGEYDLNTVQTSLFNKLADIRNSYRESEKNTSLLILNLVSNDERDKRKVIDEENDVYMFKKYVIQYSNDMWEAAKRIIPTPFCGLGTLLMRPDIFATMKEKHLDSEYALLYSIAHKLPFVKMDTVTADYNAEVPIELSDDVQELYSVFESILNFSDDGVTNDMLDRLNGQLEELINRNINE